MSLNQEEVYLCSRCLRVKPRSGYYNNNFRAKKKRKHTCKACWVSCKQRSVDKIIDAKVRLAVLRFKIEFYKERGLQYGSKENVT